MHRLGKRHEQKINRIAKAVRKGYPFDSLQDKIIFENIIMIGFVDNIMRTAQQKKDLEEWLENMIMWAEWWLGDDSKGAQQTT